MTGNRPTRLGRTALIGDFCCCAGLASDGYSMVGLHPEGFDVEPQPDYPYPFEQVDARDYLETDEPNRFTALHVSWPCQALTTAQHLRKAQGGVSRWDDLLTPGLALMRRRWNHKPWILENVEDRSGVVRDILAPMPGETLTLLCGSMFGLECQRHRLFLTNFPVRQPRALPGPGKYRAQGCDHSTFPLDPVTRRPRPWGIYHVKGDQVPAGGRTCLDEEHARHVMGSRRLLPWDKVKEGFPPAYTAYIGADLLVHLALAGEDRMRSATSLGGAA